MKGPYRILGFALAIACICLVAISPVSAGDNTPNRHHSADLMTMDNDTVTATTQTVVANRTDIRSDGHTSVPIVIHGDRNRITVDARTVVIHRSTRHTPLPDTSPNDVRLVSTKGRGPEDCIDEYNAYLAINRAWFNGRGSGGFNDR